MATGSENNHIYEVKVFDSGNFLGYLSISIDDEEMKNEALWEGQILGSDYLVWGLNHRKVKLKFENSSEVDAVVRSGGRIFQILTN